MSPRRTERRPSIRWSQKQHAILQACEGAEPKTYGQLKWTVAQWLDGVEDVREIEAELTTGRLGTSYKKAFSRSLTNLVDNGCVAREARFPATLESYCEYGANKAEDALLRSMRRRVLPHLFREPVDAQIVRIERRVRRPMSRGSTRVSDDLRGVIEELCRILVEDLDSFGFDPDWPGLVALVVARSFLLPDRPLVNRSFHRCLDELADGPSSEGQKDAARRVLGLLTPALGLVHRFHLHIKSVIRAHARPKKGDRGIPVLSKKTCEKLEREFPVLTEAINAERYPGIRRIPRRGWNLLRKDIPSPYLDLLGPWSTRPARYHKLTEEGRTLLEKWEGQRGRIGE